MHFLWKMTAGPKATVIFFILCRNCHRLYSCRLSWSRCPNDGFSHESKGQCGCHGSLSLLLSHRLHWKLLLTSCSLNEAEKKHLKRVSRVNLRARLTFNSIKICCWSTSLARNYVDVKKKFILKVKCHLLSLSFHLLQWFSASSPSSTPLWMTLSKFTMVQLSIPEFSAPFLVHTQVRIHKFSFWCNLQGSSCLYLNHYQTWFGHLSPWRLNFGFGVGGGCYNNYNCCLRIWLNPETNGSHRLSCCTCRWAPVIWKTIQYWLRSTGA